MKTELEKRAEALWHDFDFSYEYNEDLNYCRSMKKQYDKNIDQSIAMGLTEEQAYEVYCNLHNEIWKKTGGF